MTTLTQQEYDVKDVISDIVNHYGAKPSALIMILQDVQKHYRYLPQDVLEVVAKKMKLPIAQIYGVATFYRTFSLKPKGKHHVCVCTGTACHVRQATVIVDKLERDLGIKPGETTPGGEVSLETVNCLGACALGPLITVDDAYYGNMTVSRVDKILTDLKGKKTNEPAMEEAS
jgi:NADH-quinone oxidoreductase subunit E